MEPSDKLLTDEPEIVDPLPEPDDGPRWQFSLRSMFVVMTISAAILAFLTKFDPIIFLLLVVGLPLAKVSIDSFIKACKLRVHGPFNAEVSGLGSCLLGVVVLFMLLTAVVLLTAS